MIAARIATATTQGQGTTTATATTQTNKAFKGEAVQVRTSDRLVHGVRKNKAHTTNRYNTTSQTHKATRTNKQARLQSCHTGPVMRSP